MGVIRRSNVVIPTGVSRSQQNSAPPTDDEASVDSGMSTPVPPAVGGGRPAVTPAILRHNIGYRLRMKQGRKSKQRFENEKLLMAMYGVEGGDEASLGQDVAKDTRSYFSSLLSEENANVLDQFLNSEEAKYFNTQEEEDEDCAETERTPETEIQAEAAFMRIGFGMRQALKRKNVPLGMLRGIEEELNSIFSQEPGSDFTCDTMSSFERLLVHALSAYNALNSYSFDRDGRRVVRVQNPRPEFRVKDPLLSDYLLLRAAAS